MRIRWKYLLCINGILLVIWGLYIATEQIWDRKDMLHIEARCLKKLAQLIRAVGFHHGTPRYSLSANLRAMARALPGTEIMILDVSSVIRFSSVEGRVGQRWEEQDIQSVIQRRQPSSWQFKDHFHDDVAMLDVTIPVVDLRGRARYAIHVARKLELVESLLKGHRFRHAVWVFLSTILIGLVLSVITYRWLLRPINRITKMLSTSRWYGVGESRGDELQKLIDTIRQMVEQAEKAVEDKEVLLSQVESFNAKLEKEICGVKRELERTQAELVKKERLSAIGELAASLAHELRNPLHIIRGAAEILARRPDNKEASQDVLEEVDRINRFVNDLLDYTRPIEPDRESIRLAPVIQSAVSAIERVYGELGHQIEVQCAKNLELEMDEAHLHQVLVNLLSNALEATAKQGSVRVQVEKVTLHVGKGVVRPEEGLESLTCNRCQDERTLITLRVEDSGSGISPADLEQIYDPFYTRRPAGTGLGLAIVKRLVEMYGGTIDIQSELGQGTIATIKIFNRSMEQGDS